MAQVTRAEFEALKLKEQNHFDYLDIICKDLPDDIFKLQESMKVHNTNAHNQNIINQRATENIAALAARMDSMRAQIKEINQELNMVDSKLTKVMGATATGTYAIKGVATSSAAATKKRTRKNARKN
jgi:DNA-binding helix-hairpin-helix protein with protein kinase domain